MNTETLETQNDGAVSSADHLRAEDVAAILNTSRATAYRLLAGMPGVVEFSVPDSKRTMYRISRMDLMNWIENRKRTHIAERDEVKRRAATIPPKRKRHART